MFVLHGFVARGCVIALWAEDSDRAVTSRSQATRSARPHPFAAPIDMVPGVAPGKASDAVLLLPSLAKSPLDSPEMVRVTPRREPQSEPTLLPWTVTATVLEPAAALTWFDDPEDAGADGVRSGASVRYLSELAAFARELVDRGRVLPTIGHDDVPVARWRPVLQGRDVLALQALVTAMPPVCRAVPDLDDPNELAAGVLAELVDAAARARLSDVSLVPPRRGRRPKQPPAVEAWLAALTAPDGHFEADEVELAALEKALGPWGEVGVEQVGPAHATFRLTDLEPESASATDVGEPEPRWRLEFLLQSTADPSLLVPAEQAWTDDGTLRRWLEHPQELLLGELGRASRVYPRLADGLPRERPCALELDSDGAFHFLAEAAPALDAAGFGVLLPTWWDRRAKLGLRLSASSRSDPAAAAGGRFGKEQLCDFTWELAVGDEPLTDVEIAALVEAKAPLVRMRGQWVSVDREQLRRGLEFLGREKSGSMSAADILALAAAHPDDVDVPLEIIGVEADGWLGSLLDGAAPQTLQLVEPPAEFGAQLRPYQQRGLSWLSFLSSVGLGACLADDMGLGKTVQMLALEAAERSDDPEVGPTILVCPMSLVGNWQREAAKFAPHLRVYAHHGPERLRGDALAERLATVDLAVTTYGTAVRDMDELAEVDWRRVVLDEAQAVKNSQSRSAKAVRRLRAPHRIALTGTPVENRLSELWSIMDFVNPGMLGPQDRFRTHYAIPVERHGDADAAQRLRAITRPYVLRRLKTDPTIIDDLPEKIEMKQYCRLTTEQASLYQVVVDEMLEKIESTRGIERRGNVLAAMAKLKQVCNHPAQLLHDRSPVGRRSGKIIRLEEILEEILAEGDRVLCFTQFTEFAEMLLPHLAARFATDVAYLHGGTSKKARDEMVERFQSGDGPSIFLLSLKAGGTGLTLTAANHVIHLDRWWNPAVEDQATDRAFRIGQRRNVEVHKFICTGTLEEKIDDMIEAKKALANLVVSDGEGWLTELSTTELRELFSLSEGAVGE
ncbi:DEAD/DEAH box helicase [Nocardioides sp. AN3]